MKKQEVIALMSTMKYQPTRKLESAANLLEGLEEERRLTRNMFFWSGGDRRHRDYLYERYYEDYDIDLMKFVRVHYTRNLRPTRANVYASDELTLTWKGDRVDFTVSDAKKVAAAIREILEKRGKKEKKAKEVA